MTTKEFGAWSAFQGAMSKAWGCVLACWRGLKIVGRFSRRLFWPNADRYPGHWIVKTLTVGALSVFVTLVAPWWAALLVLLIAVTIIHGTPVMEAHGDREDSFVAALKQLPANDLRLLSEAKRKLQSSMVGSLYPMIIGNEILLIETELRRREKDDSIDTEEAVRTHIADHEEG